ncbi:MAG TPA: phosphotyrosine protein phosphatase [Planctomycetes bacterium]|nr:phosphotyrosine protein phosphatase [Planctomycetota bacterium]
MSETSVLFVCLGNICRSPLAEGVFLHLLAERGLSERYRVDSAGTSAYHAGEQADERSIAVGRKHGVAVPSISRKLVPEDYERFDWIVAMDGQNLTNMKRDCPPAHTGKLVKMRDYDPQGKGDVPDPYYGGPRGFDDVYEMVYRCCERFLDELEGRA